jgi:hypothetical protein
MLDRACRYPVTSRHCQGSAVREACLHLPKVAKRRAIVVTRVPAAASVEWSLQGNGLATDRVSGAPSYGGEVPMRARVVFRSLRATSYDGQDAIAIDFWPGAADEEIESVRVALDGSPHIDKVVVVDG